MNTLLSRSILMVTLCATLTAQAEWSRVGNEKIEESAGGGGLFEINPADNIYGAYYSDSTRLIHAPIAGNLEVGFLYNGIEEALYGSAGMTFRLIPRTPIAPFIGGGGNYNLSIIRYGGWVMTESGQRVEQGDSYWSMFAEAGIRFQAIHHTYWEVGARYAWTDSDLDDADYWSGRLGYGIGF